ncbi:peptidoglycan recognition protein family protein [Streptomyces carpaticus]|uniref:Peptidoglycan recognition family protein n=1 Tax=Streptomyces carpaticus TaxID=285558 RepID=A0ABV4ZN83_9ACTN
MSDADLTRRRLLLAGSAGLVAGGAAIALSGTAHAAPRAAVVEPDIDPTATWGARPPSGTISVLDNRPVKIIVHHAAGPNSTDHSRAQAHSHARWVQNLHIDENGWSDTGYHFVVSRGGWITEGRHESLRTLRAGQGLVLGAHTSGQNYDAIGICNEGAYHDGATPPQAQWDVLVSLCAYTCRQYGIAPTQLYGHKDFNATLCPGVLHDMLPRLRTEVAAALG